MTPKQIKHLLSIVVFAAFSITSSARVIKKGDTIIAFNGSPINVLDVSSYSLKLIAQAQLFNLECSMGDAFRIGAGLTGDFYLPKFASIHAEYIHSYFNLQQFDAASLNNSENTVKGFTLLELGGRFHLLDHNATARHKLILSQQTDYTYGGTITTTRYLKARFPCRRILALRGGLYRTTAPISTDMNKPEQTIKDYGAVTTKDGSLFTNVYFTNAYTTGFYLGLCDLFNMSVRTAVDGSTYNTSLLREVYADVLMASTSVDPFSVAGKTYEIEPNTKGSFQTSPIGWRVGKKMIFTRRTINLGFSMELGNRPGIAGRGLYFSSGFSMAFAN